MVDLHPNGLMIIPDQATIWAHLLNENYTLLVTATRMAGGDDRYFRNADYDAVDNAPWFLKFNAEGQYLDDSGNALSSLKKSGTLDMGSPLWQKTSGELLWRNPLVLGDGLMAGDIYYTSVTEITPRTAPIISANTVYTTLISGDVLTQLLAIPLITFGSTLTIIGANSLGTDSVLVANIVSSSGSIVSTIQGINITISGTPLTGTEASLEDELYVYLTGDELQLSYAGPTSKTFAVSYYTTTDPA